MEAPSLLVTGAGGMLGRSLCRQLLARGYRGILTPSRAELDLLNTAAVAEYFDRNRPTLVFHLAAMVYGIGGNMKNQFRSYIQNTSITSNVFLGCATTGVSKVFFAGTVASYPYPYTELPLREQSFFSGNPHYGEYGYANAKRHAYYGLEILRREQGMNYVYGVLTNLYGPEDQFDIENGHVVPSLVHKLYRASCEGVAMQVWGDGSAIRDFLYVDDAAAAIVQCMEKATGIINIAHGNAITIADVVSNLCRAARFQGEVMYQTDKPAGIHDRSVDVSRLRALGFIPKTSIEEGLAKTYRWFVDNVTSARGVGSMA